MLGGIHESDDRDGVSIPLGGSKYCCIHLLSDLVGCMQNKYLPTGDMPGGDLRLEITLANVFDGVVATERTSNGIF